MRPIVRRSRRSLVAATSAACVLALTGCGFTGLNNDPLPFGEGSGDDAITITVTMESVGNLTPNSEVKVDDLTVGSVRKIDFEDWRAELTIGLEPGTELPANATARISQKSLLGAQYLELAPPASDPRGRLTDGASIPLTSTGGYPDTEQVLSAAGVLLGGGGLENVATINRELNNALGGREADWRGLLTELDQLTSRINAQRGELVGLLEGSARLSGELAAERRVIDRALRLVPRGLAVLEETRPRAVRALQAVRGLSRDALPLLRDSRTDLVANINDLTRVLAGIGSAGKDLPGALGMATLLIPVDTVPTLVRGDFANIYPNIDLTLATLDEDFLTGTPFEGVLTGVNDLPVLDSSLGSDNPLLVPLAPPATPGPETNDDAPAGDPVPDLPIGPDDDGPVLLDDLLGLLGGGS